MEGVIGVLWTGCSSGEEVCFWEEERDDGYCTLPDSLLSRVLLEQEATPKIPVNKNRINFLFIFFRLIIHHRDLEIPS